MNGLVLLMMILGCGEQPASIPTAVPSAGEAPAPELTIAFQGQGDGEIAPCGCPKSPMGGLTRRNFVLEDIVAKGPVVTFEAGNSLMPSRMDSREAEQREIKADLIAASLKLAGIDGLTIGARDWQLGRDQLQKLIAAHDLPVVAANISCEGWDALPGHRIVERAGWKIAVIGIAAGAPVGCTERDLIESLQGEIAATPDVHVRVVLWGPDFREYEGIGAKLTGVDFVLAGQGGTPRPHPVHSGDAWLVLPHMRAKQLTLLELKRVDGATGWSPQGYREVLVREEERFRSRVESAKKRMTLGDDEEKKRAKGQLRYVENRHKQAAAALNAWDEESSLRHVFSYSHRTLDKDMAEHGATRELYDAALARIGALESAGGFNLIKRIVTGDSAFAGSHSCIPCHRPEHLQWSTTAHARAYQALVDENRSMDRECYSCHITGANHADGPKEPGAVGPMRDVQCEACHGPSRAHTLAPVDVKPVRSPAQETCTGCHDGVRDEGRFDWETYLPRVAHGGS
jgi:hypothetical protein